MRTIATSLITIQGASLLPRSRLRLPRLTRRDFSNCLMLPAAPSMLPNRLVPMIYAYQKNQTMGYHLRSGIKPGQQQLPPSERAAELRAEELRAEELDAADVLASRMVGFGQPVAIADQPAAMNPGPSPPTATSAKTKALQRRGLIRNDTRRPTRSASSRSI